MSEMETRETGAGTVSLADEEAVKQILVSTVFGLWESSTTLHGCTRPGASDIE